jgi:putative ABC transport system permease protein
MTSFMDRSPDHPVPRSSDRFMFWRLWWRAVTVKRSQAALALLSLAVGAALASMLVNLYADVRRRMTEDIRSFGANVVIAPRAEPSADSPAGSALVDQSALQPLERFVQATRGVAFTPILYGVVRVSTPAADARLPEFENAVAAGADFGRLRRLNPGWHESGEAVANDLPPGECAVGSRLAALLHVRTGDYIYLQRAPTVQHHPVAAGSDPPYLRRAASADTYHVATVLTTGASEDDQVFLPLAALQALLELPGKATLVELNIPGETPVVEDAVGRLGVLLPDLEVRPIRQIVYSEGKVLGTVRWLLLSLTSLILVIIGFCVMATMTAIVLERQKDIAVMKALGAADGLLTRIFLTEGASLGLLGGALGYAIGALLARGLATRLFGASLSLPAWTFPAVCGLAVCVAMVAAQVPLRIVRAIRPTVVLKGE